MLRKWSINKPQLLSDFPPEDLAGDPLKFDRGDGIPVLGMQWRPAADHFVYDLTEMKLVPSKRGVLSVIARIFDPLGLLSQVIFHAKCIMQRLWSTQTSWDKPLSPATAQEWQQFMDMLGWLTKINIPRCIGGSTGVQYLLCGFCDASERGYAAVLYSRVTDPFQKVTVYQLGAKPNWHQSRHTRYPDWSYLELLCWLHGYSVFTGYLRCMQI